MIRSVPIIAASAWGMEIPTILGGGRLGVYADTGWDLLWLAIQIVLVVFVIIGLFYALPYLL